MDVNAALLIANLAVWPVIVVTVLTMILGGCLRMAYRCCFQKSTRHYMVQLKDYGRVNRDQEHRLQNDDDEVDEKLTCDKNDQRASDTTNHDSDVIDIDRLQLRVTSYSSEDESLTNDTMTEDQTETKFENTQHVTELETTTEPVYPKSNSTADGRDGGGPDARKDRPLHPIPTPRLKSSSSSEQTRERTNASSEAILAQMADRFENLDKDDVFPSMLATRTKTLPPSVSKASNDTKPSLGPPPLPTTLPNWTRRGRKPPGNALQMEKAGAEELHGDIGEELMEKASNTKRKPTPPKTVPLMPLAKCPMEKECQTISVRKNSVNRRPTAPPPSVPNLAGKNHFEITECSSSGAEGGGAISREEPTNAYDEICDEQLHGADAVINHYDAIEDHLYDCIDDMPRCRRSGHRPNLARQKDVFRTEGLDDTEVVNPFYAGRLERSFKRKMKGQENNPYASFIVEDKADPGNEQKTSSPDQRMNPRGHISPKHQVDAMAFKAEPFRISLDSGYLTAIATHPYNLHVSGYKRETSKEGSSETDRPGNEPTSVEPDDIPLNDQGTHYVNECMDVDKAPTHPPLAAKVKEIKTEDGHYEDLLSDSFVASNKSLKPSVPPKPKPDKRYS
ncbi:uncharacterized protein LOC124255099 [Haliotis rubra]|uniref:uncharacterized protein LOC124255099 n=1 Tax=Haliotis rubra TaxID=36100 RepID=UPI001EE5D3A0|nr:uncharacterized protein LOC124255099 [Haliotis rubra]